MSRDKVHTVLITNIPVPYREPVHERVYAHMAGRYAVIYCAVRESNRKWAFRQGNYRHAILTGLSFRLGGRDIHLKHGLWRLLNQMSPKVLIITGFQPQMMEGFIWSRLRGCRLVVFLDGTLHTEGRLRFWHPWLRRIVFARTKAFVGPGTATRALFLSYGIETSKVFFSPLCADNKAFELFWNTEKKYDLMYCGQLIPAKLPFLFVETAARVKATRGSCRVLVVGYGELESAVKEALMDEGIDFSFPGFVQPADLPPYYASARVFLFPTLTDAWGMVAGEALAAGVPVITCDAAGAAHDLVEHGQNGYVLPVDAEIWAEYACRLLDDTTLYQQFSACAVRSVQRFNYDIAAQGILDAIHYAEKD